MPNAKPAYLLGKPKISKYMQGVIHKLGLDKMAGKKWKRYRDPEYDASTSTRDYIDDNPDYVHPYVNRKGGESALLEVHDIGLLGGGASLAKSAYKKSGLLIHLHRNASGDWAVTTEHSKK